MKATAGAIKGVVVPVITPVTGEDQLDVGAFRQLLRQLLAAGVHGVFVGGTAGEGPLLSDGVWRAAMEVARDELGDSIHLLGGATDTSVARCVDRIRILAELGYRSFVVTPTFYLRLTTDEEHLRFFGQCREAAPELDMIVYNIPAFTHSVIPPGVVCDMARRGWIRCCKESSGDDDYALDLIRRGRDVGLGVLVGHEPFMARGLRAGAAGIVPVGANVDPGTYVAAYSAATAQDTDELDRLQARALWLREHLIAPGNQWIAAIKYAVARRGVGNGRPVRPFPGASSATSESVDALLRALGESSLVPVS